MEFKLIKAKDLYALSLQLAESDADPLPISPWRALSQVKNPTVHPDDVLLVVASNEQKQIKGYIGVLPLQTSLLEGGNIFWNTCWWVAKDAGAAVSMTLLSHFFKLTSKRIAFSDLSEHTVKILGSFGDFTVMQRPGGIFRFRSAFHERALGKKSIFLNALRKSYMLRILDQLINIGRSPALKKGIPDATDLDIVWKDRLEENYGVYISENNQNGWLTPDAALFDWWKDYPWLATPAQDKYRVNARYYFSSVAREFKIRILEVRKSDQLLGLAICSIRDGVLKTNFLYFSSGNEDVLSKAILNAMISDKNIHTIVSFNEMFVSHLEEFGIKPAVEKTRYTAYSDTIRDELKSEPVFQDGDGDYVFT